MRRGKLPKDYWEEPVSTPTAAGMSADARARKAARMRHLVRACVVSYPLVALALLIQTASAFTAGADHEVAAPASAPTQVQAAAVDEVSRWLEGEPSPLPGARVLGWQGASLVPWPTVERRDKGEDYQSWTAHVLLATDAATYDAAVGVLYSPTHGTSVLASPALTLLPPGEEGWQPDAWPLAQTESVSEQVRRAVEAWGKAYTSGNADTLTAVVADPDTAHVYQPLTGIASASVSVDGAATRAVDDGAEPDKDTVMAQVTIQARRGQDDERAFTLSFDVLVTGATSGSARVVAWGAPGTGATLSPYVNAVPRAASAAEPTAAPTASATPKEDDSGQQ